MPRHHRLLNVHYTEIILRIRNNNSNVKLVDVNNLSTMVRDYYGGM